MNDQTPASQTAIICDLRFGAFRTRRKVHPATVLRDDTNADTSALHVAKVIMDAPELRQVLHQQYRTKKGIDRFALPTKTLRGGMYLIPVDLAQDTEDWLDRVRNDWQVSVDKFLDAYPGAIATARLRLGDVFDEDDYPDVLDIARQFQFRWSWIAMDVPETLGRISSVMFQKERDKAAEQWRDIQIEVRDNLRIMFSGLLNHLCDRLAPDAQGNRKILRGSVLSKIEEFVGSFDGRNITNDDELAAMVTQCRNIVSGIDVQAIKRNDTLRRDTQQAVANLCAEVDDNLVRKPRRIQIETDDLAAAS